MKDFAHNQIDSLFKYSPIETAIKILSNGTFRYSSPFTFNDPFDIQTELHFPFNINHLPQIILDRMNELITDDFNVAIDPNDSWGKIFTFLRNKHIEGDYSLLRLKEFAIPLLEYLCNIIEQTRAQYNQEWEKELKKIKIFCLSENYQNILMWSHYAQYHTGVCFKLKVMPNMDNTICAARKVNYCEQPPAFFTVKDWVDSVLLNKQIDVGNIYREYPLVKYNIWKYEEEWRVWAPFDESQDKTYHDMPIYNNEIEAIYIGAKADLDLSKKIIKLGRNRGITSFFQCFMDSRSYSLKFMKI
ncbi:MAG: DUF2971 domain-containing protein [Deltaproteobacteria bacterium]|nr:DUF2971 domain-containing protein [Deltaproteobacteria bacterium]